MFLSVLTKRFFILSASSSILYFLLSIYLTNPTLITDTVLGNYSLIYKEHIISGLLQGLTTSISSLNLILLISISILTGLNLALLSGRMHLLQKKSGHLLAGGSILGTITGGCASCGLPILGALGLTGSLAYLPFKGLEISALALILLAISFFVLLKKTDPKYCKV